MRRGFVLPRLTKGRREEYTQDYIPLGNKVILHTIVFMMKFTGLLSRETWQLVHI